MILRIVIIIIMIFKFVEKYNSCKITKSDRVITNLFTLSDNQKVTKINNGIIRNIASKLNIIWNEMNIPIHEFLEFVSNREIKNSKQIIVVISFLDIFLLDTKK